MRKGLEMGAKNLNSGVGFITHLFGYLKQDDDELVN